MRLRGWQGGVSMSGPLVWTVFVYHDHALLVPGRICSSPACTWPPTFENTIPSERYFVSQFWARYKSVASPCTTAAVW
jgi:hypothetical protein